MTNFRLTAVPAWALVETKPAGGEVLHPDIDDAVALGDVLARIEYRGEQAGERLQRLTEGQAGPVVYARPPNDLPALLRTADQLVSVAREEAGEQVHRRRCECGAPYIVPIVAVRPMSLKCQRCGRTVDLDPPPAQGATAAAGRAATVHDARLALSTFFREAMARGWPVLAARR